MKNKLISLRLIIMNFLEFAVWGAYLTSMGSFLGKAGLGSQIWLFFATQGFVSIFMPALVGIVADKWIPAQKTLSCCHLIAGAAMLATGLYAMNNVVLADGAYVTSHDFSFGTFYALYTISVAFFMPTIAIANSVAYANLESAGKDPVVAFPPIRVFGTIGFIVTMLFVNFMRDPQGIQYQHSYYQFLTSGALSIVLFAYALTLPGVPIERNNSKSFMEQTGLKAFSLFKKKEMAIFFIFSMLLGAALQITNGYANTFISSFANNPEYASTWGANNANALISISQMSETLCILLIPFFMKRFGIKVVMLISMFAWVFRFGLFGAGNPGAGVWMFILSCLVYGVAFDFFNISGSLYVNKMTTEDIRSSVQGLFMLMTNGLGASIGTWVAGKVVNHYVYNAANPDWSAAWYVFAGYAFVVGILFLILFRDPDRHKSGVVA
ncbi:MAG: MFS transporter [Bacteroidales bacterium]|nr:MFS transporter [Bacteroidales bacterium]